MTEQTIDLDAYLARIGYDGSREPTLGTLQGIQFAHAISVPFENLNILFGKGVQLDLTTLEKKIAGEGRGGYCFEQNGLAIAALRQLGFQVTGLIGRVRWMLPDDVPAPLTHMLIRVDLPEGAYIFDGGFGGIRMTAPLKLEPDLVQKTPHEDHRIVQDGMHYTIQANLGHADLGDQWASTCRFTLEPQTPADYEVSSWYTSTHPESLFTNNLIVERPAPGFRRMIFNDMFVERKLGAPQETTMIESVDQMVSLLHEHFDLLVEGEAERAALAPFIGKSAAA